MVSYRQIKRAFRGNSSFFIACVFIQYCFHIFQILWSLLYRFYKTPISENPLQIHGMHYLATALEQNKGVILVCGHTGNWELCANLSTTQLNGVGLVCNYIRKKPRQVWLETLVFATAQKHGVRIIHHDTSTLREALRSLKKNQLVFFVMDQNPKHRTQVTKVHFLGHTYHTYHAMAKLALKTKSPVLVVYSYKDTKHGNHAVLLPVSNQDCSEQLTQNCMTVLENYILSHPSQWIWSYPWKNYEAP